MDHNDHVKLLRPADLSSGATSRLPGPPWSGAGESTPSSRIPRPALSGIAGRDERWADLGAGSGAFTLALRELLGLSAEIYAVDRNRGRLAELLRACQARFGDSDNLHLMHADFTRALDLPLLDGVLMANSLHFFRDKQKILQHVGSLLKPGGVLLLVEYNVDRGNPWVPHPLSFETFRDLAPKTGFSEPRLLAKHPSSFLREFYSALSFKHTQEEPSAD